jgi:hypothetical protein
MLSRLPRFLGHGGSMGNLCQCYDTVPPYGPVMVGVERVDAVEV